MSEQKSKVMHGVFLDVFGLGVLLTGDSGIGKSEIALNLINRSHRLIADDTVELTRIDDETLMGRCPVVLQDFLEVRGLGILNIREMFGDIAVKNAKRLHLVINLLEITHEEFKTADRLHGIHRKRQILKVVVPEVSIPVSPGRNLAILVEGAVRNELLRAKGYYANLDFIKRHRKMMQTDPQDK